MQKLTGFFKVCALTLLICMGLSTIGYTAYTVYTQFAEDAGHTSGDKGTMALCVRNDTAAALAGTTLDYIPCTTDSLGGMWVAIDHMVQIIGAVAHDAVDAQPPVKVGNKAIAHGTNPTAVAAADVTDHYANRAGIPFVIGGHPNIVTLELAFTAAQTDTAVVTVGAGAKIVVTSAEATCANSNTVDVAFRMGFGTANTPTTTGVVLTHPGIAAGSGVNRGNGAGMIGVGADNEDLRLTAGVPTTGSCRALVSYYTIES